MKDSCISSVLNRNQFVATHFIYTNYPPSTRDEVKENFVEEITKFAKLVPKIV